MSNIIYKSFDNHVGRFNLVRYLKFTSIFLFFVIGFWLCLCFPFYQGNEGQLKSASNLRKREPFDVDNFIKIWKQRKPFCSAPKILDFMLNDPFIQKYTKHIDFKCNKSKNYTNLDQMTARLTLTIEAIKDQVSCFYSFLWRTHEKDNHINYSRTEKIPKSGVRLSKQYDILNVTCKKYDQIIYKNTHIWIPDLEPKIKSNVKGPSVLVLFLESASYVSFKRYMTKTAKSLERLGHMHYMKGFVKQSDNSFPNSIAFLTGLKIDPEFEKVFFGTYFDDIKPKINYLWDDFSQRGYVTGLHEDLALIGLFQYGKWGWKTPPVDWYPRAFWVQMYPESGSYKLWNSMNLHEEFCFTEPKVEIFLDQVYHFMKRMSKSNQPYFLYSFHSQMTHDDINNFKIVDEPFANFFAKTRGMFNDTLLILAGDHGPRYGSPSVPTGFGRLEERMNLVSIRVPESLNKRYPHLRKYLKANEDRLTSWSDIHMLVQDIARQSYEPIAEVREKYGPMSPWRELVHPDRTCDDAYIYPAYCICNGTMDTDHRLPERYDMKWSYKAVEDFVNLAIEEAKRKSLKRSKSCDSNQKVNTGHIDMKYVLPVPGQNFLTDNIKIKVFLEPANVYLSTNVIVKHHVETFTVVDDKDRVFKLVCDPSKKYRRNLKSFV